MNWFAVAKLPLKLDLEPLLNLCRQQQIQIWVSEEQGHQLVWLQQRADVEFVLDTIEQIDQNRLPVASQSEDSVLGKKSVSGFLTLRAWRQYWQTILLIFASAVGGLLVSFDSAGSLLHWLTFVDFYNTQSIGQSGISSLVDSGQWWRLLTPMFLHFDLLHFLFNAVWIWEFGRRIETLESSGKLLLVTFFSSLSANLMQASFGGSMLFGGMSGVVFGYVGYVAVLQRLRPTLGYDVPWPLLGFMLAWLALGFTGLVDFFIDGSIANGAHLGGLMGGILVGCLQLLQQKNSTSEKI